MRRNEMTGPSRRLITVLTANVFEQEGSISSPRFKGKTMRRICLSLLCAVWASAIAMHESLATDPQHHEEHKHAIEDPKLKELNERYDRAWAEWQRQFFGVEIAEGMTIGEIGAGDGTMALLMARKVGEEGHVYANEIVSDKVERMRAVAREQDVSNVTTILGEPDDPRFPVGEIDLVLMVEVLHHVTAKERLLAATCRQLKPGAQLVIVEPDIDQEGGHEGGCYSDPDATREVIEKAGFEYVKMDRISVQDTEFFVLTVRAP
jgi:2-polyprenyl-3-methyl-5-hydroxy-6-metoxy-1,4-benzoquinol methylase